jgi:hypothetical protein
MSSNPPRIFGFNARKQLPLHGILLYVGRTKSGKSFLMRDHMYFYRKKIDIVVAMTGSKDTAIELEKHIPALYIYDDLDLEKLKSIYDRQEFLKARELRGKGRCPNVLLYLDDLGYKKKNVLSSEIMAKIAFNGRHANILCMIAIQDCKILGPALRQQARQVFVLQEKNPQNRKRVFDSFNPCFERFEDFDETMKLCTQNYEALVLENQLTNSYAIEDNIFYYKAKDRGNFRINRGGRIWRHSGRLLDKDHDIRSKREKETKKKQTVQIVRSRLPV